MADPRFFTHASPLSLKEVALLTAASLADEAHATHTVVDVAPLDRAHAGHASFLDNVKYVETFAHSKAGACFIRPKYASRAPASMALLLTDDPYRAFAKLAQYFYPSPAPVPFISPLAFIDQSAVINHGCRVDASAYIGAHVTLGEDCHIGPNAVLHDGVKIGDHTRVGACSTLSHTLIGSRVIIHRGVHIGQDGFGYAMGREGHLKMPQLGRVIIEDDVEIGSGSCIDRGTGPDTHIGQGSKIDNLVQIGHNVVIGKMSIIIAQTGIAGSSRIGDGVILAGQVGISGHIKIGAGARIAAQSGVIHDIPAGSSYGGSPAVPVKDWHRQTIALSRLSRKKEAEDE